MRKPPSVQRRTPSPAQARTADLLRRALALHQSGRPAEASTLYRQVLASEPRNPAANHLLGLVRLNAGDPAAAIELIGRAITENGSDPHYHANLGVALNAVGRPKEALASFSRALTLDDKFAEVWSNQGMALRSLNRLDEAVASYRAAIRLRPAMTGFHLNLGNALLAQGEPQEAVTAIRRALELRPDHPETLGALASALSALGRDLEAATTIASALALRPDDPALLAIAGEAHSRAGNSDAAIAAYRRAIVHKPDGGELHRLLSYLVRHERRDSEVAAMEQLVADAAQSDETRMLAGFGLGKALSDLGEHRRSAECFVAANALARRHRAFSIEAAEAELERLQRPFEAIPPRLRHSGFSEADPIFIVGLPRSGKTTLERLLSRHPILGGAGELTKFNRLVQGLLREHGATSKPLDLEQLPTDYLARLGRDYAEFASGLVDPGLRSLDTMPPNFRLIGFIRLALPRARIIHCVREPVTHCISIFERHFSEPGYGYASDLGDLTRYYRRYTELMLAWRRLFPEGIIDVDVGRFHGDSGQNMERLLHFCDLPAGDSALVLEESELPERDLPVHDHHAEAYRGLLGGFSDWASAREVLFRPNS